MSALRYSIFVKSITGLSWFTYKTRNLVAEETTDCTELQSFLRELIITSS